MRSFLTWLLVFGVLAGAGMRGTAATRIVVSHSHAHEHGHEMTPWHGDHDHDHHDHGGDEPAEDDSAPGEPGHHHHHVDVAPSPMVPLSSHDWEIVLTTSLLFERGPLDVRAPDGPYADLDSPPLI